MFLVFLCVCLLSIFMLWYIFVQFSSSYESELEEDTNDEVKAYDESNNQTLKVCHRMFWLSKYVKHFSWLY